MNNPKKICIASIANPLLDTRITNLSASLRNDGYIVKVIGFNLYLRSGDYFKDDLKVFSLDRSLPSLLFYYKFAFYLLQELLSTSADIYIAEDIQTLPLATIIAKIRKKKVFYNSREIYAFIGGLRNKPVVQKIIKTVESYFIHKVDLVLTTGDMDSEFLQKQYGINNTLTIRNIPQYNKPQEKADFRKKYNIGDDKLILLYQGIIVEGRGIAPTIEALMHVSDAFFILLGDGPQLNNYIKLAEKFGVSDRVIFAGAYKQEELSKYTAGADIGLTLIENISISYYYALPNKLFEYIMAEIPVISSDLPQMKKIVEEYKVGAAINIDDNKNIVKVLKQWCADKKLLHEYKINCAAASRELNWREEYKIFQKVLPAYLHSK